MRSIFSLADKNEKTNLVKRHRIGKASHAAFFLATAIGLVALVTLLLSIVNQSFGLMAVEYKVDPATLANRPLEELSDTELIDILKSNVSKIRLRTLEKEKPLEQRLHDDLLELVNAQVVGQRIVNTCLLYTSPSPRDS